MYAPLDLNQEMTIPSDTGMVTITEDGDAIMTTGSPVMLTVFPNISQPFNVLQIEFSFSEQNAGLLSVYFDGSQVFAINGADVFAAAHDEFDEVPPSLDFNTGALVLGDYFEPGFHTLLFRLDSPNGGQSSVQISNIRFGLETAVVPEPTTGFMCLSAFVAALCAARSIRRS
jgi:hypothetical protein